MRDIILAVAQDALRQADTAAAIERAAALRDIARICREATSMEGVLCDLLAQASEGDYARRAAFQWAASRIRMGWYRRHPMYAGSLR